RRRRPAGLPAAAGGVVRPRGTAHPAPLTTSRAGRPENEFSATKDLSMAKPLNVGMIGYGFMGRAHSNAYVEVNHFFDLQYRPVLKAVCARSADKARAFADQWGYESVETDWRKLIGRKDIDLIDICTPNNLHAEIALAAAQASKMILCEKPLAMNAPEGLTMVEAV